MNRNSQDLCAAGYIIGHGPKCKTCGAGPNEACRRLYEVITKLETQQATMLAALRAHAAYASCEATGRGSLPQRMAIYEHAQALTAQALAAVNGEAVPEYVGDAEVERLVDEALGEECVK